MNSYDGNEPIESKNPPDISWVEETEEKDTTGPTAMFEGLATIFVGLLGVGLIGVFILFILKVWIWLWPFS